jgi:ribosomal protein S18 acetylase RimI-like enzyme
MNTPEFQFDSYIFKVAQETDIPALEQLVNSAYRGEVSKKGWTTEADLLAGERVTAATLLKDIENASSCIYICQNLQEQIYASVFLQKKQDKLYVGMLSVSPHLQNTGIGKLLLQLADKVAFANDCTALTMTVITVRTELIAWYNRHGFLPTGETFPFNIPDNIVLTNEPLHFVVLEKVLVV